MEADSTTARATLGGGCFWCLEAVFRRLRGVVSVDSGYAGGETADPTYEAVCTGTTGHAEVVQIEYRPEEIGFEDLLQVFFAVHDPTTPNRQGHDVGPQYRSIVLFHDDEQRRLAEAMIRRLENEGAFENPVVTQVEPLERFYPAEAYHRDYFERNGRQPYCQVVIAPKLGTFRQQFAKLLRDQGS